MLRSQKVMSARLMATHGGKKKNIPSQQLLWFHRGGKGTNKTGDTCGTAQGAEKQKTRRLRIKIKPEWILPPGLIPLLVALEEKWRQMWSQLQQRSTYLQYFQLSAVVCCHKRPRAVKPTALTGHKTRQSPEGRGAVRGWQATLNRRIYF